MYCRYFDDTNTALPTCTLLRKFTEADWSCAEFEKRD